MKFSIITSACIICLISLSKINGFCDDDRPGNNIAKEETKKSKEKDFCTLAVDLLNNCNTDFKKIRTKMTDSFKSDSETTIALYESNLIIPKSISTTIYYNNFEGFSYEAIMSSTEDIKLFQDTYNTYKKMMANCKGLHLEYTDSTEGRYVKGYPQLAFIKKGEKNAETEAFPNSIRLAGECKDGKNYSVSIWVYQKRK